MNIVRLGLAGYCLGPHSSFCLPDFIPDWYSPECLVIGSRGSIGILYISALVSGVGRRPVKDRRGFGNFNFSAASRLPAGSGELRALDAGAALVLGWAVSFLLVLPEAVVMMVMAFIAGGVILNVLKEELP